MPERGPRAGRVVALALRDPPIASCVVRWTPLELFEPRLLLSSAGSDEPAPPFAV